jgi:S1-C subfamily serine protease
VALDGEKLTATGPEHSDELATLIRQYDVGKTVDLTILRDKEEKKISVELARSARLQREMKKYRNDEFEFTVRDVSFFDAAQQQWDSDQRGALVDEVKSGSWAELGSLYVSDLIVSVDGDAIDNVEMLRKKMEQIAERKPGVVVMKVKRGIHTAFLELEPNWKN